MTFSEVEPIFSEADSAGTLFLFTVFGDKKSKSLRGSSGTKFLSNYNTFVSLLV
jgi:hypothetical protein